MGSGGSHRLFIDGRVLEAPFGTGVTTYARTLIAAAELAGERVHLLRTTRGRQGFAGRLARYLRASRPTAIVAEDADGDLLGEDVFRLAQVRFNRHGQILRLVAPGPPGIMHWTYPVPIMIEGWLNIYTVHDAIPILHPGLTPIDGKRHRHLLDTLVKSAARIVTVSEAARQDLMQSFGWAGDFVTNLGLAVQVETRGPGSLPLGLRSREYLLFCGQIEPRKNLFRLIEAYAASGITMPLVLVGPDGWGARSILRKAASVRGVMRIPYLERASLLNLIANARALVLPSLAEGFGLPLAEAMALGTPTLISRDPALCEVAGGAALSVDGEDVAEMAGALARLANDEALCADLSKRGLARAPAFQIEAFGARLASFYAGLVAEHA